MITSRSTAAVDRWVDGSYERIDSIVSPANSSRTAADLPAENIHDAATNGELAMFVAGSSRESRRR